MPFNVIIGEDEVERIETGTGGNKEYKRQIERILNHFLTFVKDVKKDGRSIEDIYANSKEDFEDLVKCFFYSLRVEDVDIDKKTGKKTKTGKQISPKIVYAKNIKSTLFKSFTSKYQIDLKDLILFPGHYDWWSKYLGSLKQEGRGTITHKKELEHDFNEKVMELAYHALEALKNRDNPEIRDLYLSYIPPAQRSKGACDSSKYKYS